MSDAKGTRPHLVAIDDSANEPSAAPPAEDRARASEPSGRGLFFWLLVALVVAASAGLVLQTQRAGELQGTVAALEGELDLAVSNVISSNISNVTLVLGSAALITPIVARRRVIKREGALMFASVAVLATTLANGSLDAWEGFVLLGLLGVAIWLMIRWSSSDPDAVLGAVDDEEESIAGEDAEDIAAWRREVGKEILIGVGALIVTVIAADFLLDGVIGIGVHFGLSALFLNRGTVGGHARRQVGKGREFEQLREYAPGDDYTDIFWKGTARRGFPMTKTFQIERTQEVYVVIDHSRLSGREIRVPVPTLPGVLHEQEFHAGGEFTITTQLEKYLQAALVLGSVAERQADLFGLITFSDQVDHFVRSKNGRQPPAVP